MFSQILSMDGFPLKVTVKYLYEKAILNVVSFNIL
jgi:hypothetical protein